VAINDAVGEISNIAHAGCGVAALAVLSPVFPHPLPVTPPSRPVTRSAARSLPERWRTWLEDSKKSASTSWQDPLVHVETPYPCFCPLAYSPWYLSPLALT